MPHYSQKQDLFPMQGGCSCGLIRYELTLPPLMVHCCHCTACQRQLGTAFALNAIVESSAVRALPSLETPTIPVSVADAAGDGAGSPAAVTAAATATTTGYMTAFARLTNATPANPPDYHNSDTPTHQPVLTTIPSESHIGQTTAHCPACHTPLYSFYADGGPTTTYLRVGTLDAGYAIEPDAHIFTRSMRRDVVRIGDGTTPQFETYYPDRRAFYRPDTAERVEALEREVGAWRVALRRELGGGEDVKM